MSSGNKYNSVNEYLQSMPENVRNNLIKLKSLILKVVPDAEELINYNIPAYALRPGGKRDHQIMIAGFKQHIGLYPHPSTMERFANELSQYKTGKGSVQFPLNQPLPEQLIMEMIEYRKNEIANQ